MLGLSSKTYYAIAALYTLDTFGDNKVIKIKDIAQHANIPQNFLEQILLTLKKKGILISIKGAHGGYKLHMPLEKITLGMIIDILEDNYFNAVCKTDHTLLTLFWEDITNNQRKVFDIPLSIFKSYQTKINQTLDYSI